MVEKVLDALTIKLHELYDLKIYFNAPNQNMATPCFLISVGETTIKSALPPRKQVSLPLVIQLISDKKYSRKEMFGIGYHLSNELEYVLSVEGDVIRGSNISYEVDDELMSLYITFDFYVQSVITTENDMTKMIGQVGVKNG